ncbi:uncharacterized protein LOC117190960 [Drosophila miranda]|uniref:uncharacterized protein LOC117190960 n=1 Tax=Drosophila miranda TaxID=7229 RepID=UPI00143F1219|nr:uncharacterized protein LOC117190960 [Drosophila miranda]
MVPVFGFCLGSWINSTFWRRGAITSVMAPMSSIKPRRISSCSVLLRVSAMLPLHVSCACAMATFTPERISEGSALDWPGKFQLSSPRPSAPCVSPPCICPWRLPGGGVLRVIFCLDRKLYALINLALYFPTSNYPTYLFIHYNYLFFFQNNRVNTTYNASSLIFSTKTLNTAKQ